MPHPFEPTRRLVPTAFSLLLLASCNAESTNEAAALGSDTAAAGAGGVRTERVEGSDATTAAGGAQPTATEERAGAAGAAGTASQEICPGESWLKDEFINLPCTEYTLETTPVAAEELPQGVACSFLLPLSIAGNVFDAENMRLIQWTSETTLDHYPVLSSLDDCSSSEFGGWVLVAPSEDEDPPTNSGSALLCPCTCARLGATIPVAFVGCQR